MSGGCDARPCISTAARLYHGTKILTNNFSCAPAADLHIELCFLPAYSLNLNLIERLWKFVKSACLYSEYAADFASFKAAIATCLAQTHSTHKSALDTLLTLKFQLFEKAQFRPV